MKSEIEKRQREDDTVRPNQSTQQSEPSEIDCDEESKSTLSNGINSTPTKLVAC